MAVLLLHLAWCEQCALCPTYEDSYLVPRYCPVGLLVDKSHHTDMLPLLQAIRKPSDATCSTCMCLHGQPVTIGKRQAVITIC